MKSLTEEQLIEKRNLYHQNLYELYKHVIIGSWHYLNAIHFLSDKKFCRTLPPLLKEDEKPSVDELGNLLLQLSKILLDTANAITNDELEIKKEKIRIYNGRILDMTIWQYFLQHMTHQTHHQGQISLMMDEMGMEHEFGNVFPLLY